MLSQVKTRYKNEESDTVVSLRRDLEASVQRELLAWVADMKQYGRID